MKKILLILLCLPMIGFGQNVNIPDANFKAYLVGNTSINTNGDTEIQVSEASVFNGAIDCNSMSISDLTGIEDFTALAELNCDVNQLTTLDVSNNLALTYLDCEMNQLISLDVSNNAALSVLACNDNPLTSLDLSSTIALTNLYLQEMYNLSSLDLRNGNNQNLYDLGINNAPNLYCINVDNVAWSTTNWTSANYSIDSHHYFSENCNGTTSIQEHTTNKELLKVTDLLGRETEQTNQPLFYIYDDGTVEKRIVIE